MEPTPQMLALFLGSTVVGGVVMKLIDWARDGIAGRATRRRSEVDRALQERDKALAAESWQARWARKLEESLLVHRRQMIEAPCITPEKLPDYPSRPEKE